MRGSALFVLVGIALLAPREAAAHIEITSHETRHGVANQKIAPCGVAGDTGPGDTVYTYAPGETISLSWHEFIDHPGHYRVAFDSSGEDDFVDPASADDLYNSDAVLLDGIPDEADVHDYEVELTFPSDVECESCTIQILQVMTDKPPFGDGNDMYYHCIDVRLVAEGGDGDGDPGGDGDGDGDGDPGDGDGDPGEGDGDGTSETGSETGSPIEASESGCACAADPGRSGAAGSFALLALALIRRRKARRQGCVEAA